ncbi:MAG: hypothetical protein EP330_27525 [Deltaproteobacteria bacterium]|nr:MAG: hypothetical protein EP330_27525 [Deltaproteobacteria bacterium]
MRWALLLLVGCQAPSVDGEWVVARELQEDTPTEGCPFDRAVDNDVLLVRITEGDEGLEAWLPALDTRIPLTREEDALVDELGDLRWETDRGVITNGRLRMARPDLGPACVVDHRVQGWRLDPKTSTLSGRYTLTYGEREPSESPCKPPPPPREAVELHFAHHVYVDFLPLYNPARERLAVAVFPESGLALPGTEESRSFYIERLQQTESAEQSTLAHTDFHFRPSSHEGRREVARENADEHCYLSTPFTMEES